MFGIALCSLPITVLPGQSAGRLLIGLYTPKEFFNKHMYCTPMYGQNKPEIVTSAIGTH